MADLQLPCSYDIHPSFKTYEITAGSYLSQRAEYAGIVCAMIIILKGRVLLLQRASDDDLTTTQIYGKFPVVKPRVMKRLSNAPFGS